MQAKACNSVKLILPIFKFPFVYLKVLHEFVVFGFDTNNLIFGEMI